MEENYPKKNSKKDLLARFQALKSERQSGWDQQYRDIADNILPRRGRFFTSETNSATYSADRKRLILNSKPTVAARTLRAIMVNGMVSAARRWFLGAVDSLALKEVQSVKDWAYEVELAIRDQLKKSNAYQCLDNVMGDLGSFGTSVLYVEDDLTDGIRCYVFPVGSYVLASNGKGDVDTCIRETSWTVRQLVDEFGEENCSSKVQDDFKKKRYDARVDVLHFVGPNPDYQPGMLGPAGMQFSSCWFEAASAGDTDEKFLREGGYAEDPLMKPRWSTTGDDTYGSDCPGFEAVGDAKVLQLTCKREEQAFDKITNPPMAGPTSLIGQRSSILAGDITYVDVQAGGQKFEPSVTIPPAALQAFALKIDRLERSIEAAYYADLALMFQRLNQGQMTATEINARQQEQMTLLGSMNERAERELLRPMLWRIFMILWRNGKLPAPPEELVGSELKFDFVSQISQAQKLLSTANLERLLAMAGNMAAVFPEVVDKIDADQVIDEYGDALAVQPSVVRSDDEVEAIRAERAERQAQAEQAQQMAAGAEGAKVLSQADTSGDNALTRLLGNITGQPPPGTPRQ
jgi:hypothetical protein